MHYLSLGYTVFLKWGLAGARITRYKSISRAAQTVVLLVVTYISYAKRYRLKLKILSQHEHLKRENVILL